jgi:hypothetical protein
MHKLGILVVIGDVIDIRQTLPYDRTLEVLERKNNTISTVSASIRLQTILVSIVTKYPHLKVYRLDVLGCGGVSKSLEFVLIDQDDAFTFVVPAFLVDLLLAAVAFSFPHSTLLADDHLAAVLRVSGVVLGKLGNGDFRVSGWEWRGSSGSTHGALLSLFRSHGGIGDQMERYVEGTSGVVVDFPLRCQLGGPGKKFSWKAYVSKLLRSF